MCNKPVYDCCGTRIDSAVVGQDAVSRVQHFMIGAWTFFSVLLLHLISPLALYLGGQIVTVAVVVVVAMHCALMKRRSYGCAVTVVVFAVFGLGIALAQVILGGELSALCVATEEANNALPDDDNNFQSPPPHLQDATTSPISPIPIPTLLSYPISASSISPFFPMAADTAGGPLGPLAALVCGWTGWIITVGVFGLIASIYLIIASCRVCTLPAPSFFPHKECCAGDCNQDAAYLPMTASQTYAPSQSTTSSAVIPPGAPKGSVYSTPQSYH